MEKAITLFGSYTGGSWVDEPQTVTGDRSAYDILVIANTVELADRQHWDELPRRSRQAAQLRL